MCTTTTNSAPSMDFESKFESVYDSNDRPFLAPQQMNQNYEHLTNPIQTNNIEEGPFFTSPYCDKIPNPVHLKNTDHNPFNKENPNREMKAKNHNQKTEDHKNNEQGEKPANPTSYKYLSWREKDRRRRFREEWKNLWLVIPHGKYEVMCLVCHKVMTQRKLDTIKRHTIRRHVELLSMTDADRQVLFNLLLSVHNQQQIENGINPETGMDANGNKIENGLIHPVSQPSVEGQQNSTEKGRNKGTTSPKNISPVASVQLKRMYTQQFSNAKNNSLLKKLKTEPEKKFPAPRAKDNLDPLAIPNMQSTFHNIFEQLRSNMPHPSPFAHLPPKRPDLAGLNPDLILQRLKQNIFNSPSNLGCPPHGGSLPQPPQGPFGPQSNEGLMNRQVPPNISAILNANNPNQPINFPMLFSAFAKVQSQNGNLPPVGLLERQGLNCIPEGQSNGFQEEVANRKSHPFSVLSLAMNDGKEEMDMNSSEQSTNHSRESKSPSDIKIEESMNENKSIDLPDNALVSLTSNNSSLQVHILNFSKGKDLIPSVELYLRKNNFHKAVILNCQGFVSSVSLKQIEDNLDQKDDVEINTEHRVISLSGMILTENARDQNLFLVLCNGKGELEGGRLSGQMITKEEFKIVLLVMGQSSRTNTTTDTEAQICSSKEKGLSDDSSSCYSAKTPESSESPVNQNRIKTL